MQNKFCTIILVICFFIINISTYASSEDFVAISQLVDNVRSGDTITIKGTTSFEIVNISISRPNGTPFYYKVASKEEFENGINVTFPIDIEQAPLGKYTINIGSGNVFDRKTLDLSNSLPSNGNMISVNKTIFFPGDTLTIIGATDFEMVNVSIARPNGTQFFYKLATKAEIANGINVNFSANDSLGIYKIRVGYENVFETKNVELKEKAIIPVTGGRTGGGNPPSVAPSLITPIVPPIATPVNFKDIDDVPWAKESIDELSKIGVINGASKENFAPQNNITRAEFIKIIVGAFGIETNGKTDFADVNSNDWYYQYVQAGYSAGIIKGTDDGRFSPQDNISREQAAVILYRVVQLKKIKLLQINGKAQFEDDITDWAIEATNALYAGGIISGKEDKLFAPQDNMTRAEAAKIIYGVYKIK